MDHSLSAVDHSLSANWSTPGQIANHGVINIFNEPITTKSFAQESLADRVGGGGIMAPRSRNSLNSSALRL